MANKSNRGGCLRQFFITLLVLVLLLAGIVIGASLFFSSMGSKPKITSNTYLTWNIKMLPEYKETQMFQLSKPLSMDVVKAVLESARDDDRVLGLVIDFSNQAIPGSSIEEIREMIIDFKSKGKKIYAYADNYVLGNYRLASLADRIFMADTDNCNVSFIGYAVYQPYMKDMLDKLGIKMQVLHQGEYKGAGENLSRTDMSDAVEEDYKRLFGSIFDIRVSDIAENRNLDKSEFERDILSGKYAVMTAREALEAGFVDELCYYRNIKNTINDGKKLNMVSISSYTPKFKKAEKKIAVVYADGEIRTGSSGNNFSPWGGFTKVLGSDTVVKQFTDILEDDSIKGVVFRVDSPGGSALASQLMYDAIKEVNAKKPVIVSMSSVAASGGYYISMASRKIVVQPSTITGSIGVVSVIPDMSEAFKKLGINMSGFHVGKYSDFGSTDRALNDEEKELFDRILGNIYTEFKTRVSENRGIPMDELEEYARGRVYTGLQAIEVGLADEVGGIPKAIELLKAELGMSADEEVFTVQYPKEKTFFEMLSEGDFMSSIMGRKSWAGGLEPYGTLAEGIATWIERAFYYNRANNPLMLYTEYIPEEI